MIAQGMGCEQGWMSHRVVEILEALLSDTRIQ